MLHSAAAHHGFEVGAFIWTEGAHPKPLLSLLSEAGTWAACWGEPWPNAHSTEARSHLGSDIWERHGTSWTENVMRDPAPAEARMGPLLWKALPPGTANKSLHLPWGTDLPVLGWTKLMSRLESNMDSAQAAQDRPRDGSHTEVEQLEATACCCKAWTNPMDPRSAGPLFPQLITLFQVTALSGNQFAKFWVSPVSRLKKNTQVFSSWQGTFSPQPQQPGEMTRSKGRSLQPGAQTSNPLSRICSMPSPSLLAHPLSSSSNAPLTSCQRKIPPGKGHRPFQNGGGEHLCRGRCCRNAAWGLQNATTPLPPWLSDAEHSWGDPSAVTGMIRSDLMHVQTKAC